MAVHCRPWDLSEAQWRNGFLARTAHPNWIAVLRHTFICLEIKGPIHDGGVENSKAECLAFKRQRRAQKPVLATESHVNLNTDRTYYNMFFHISLLPLCGVLLRALHSGICSMIAC